MALLIIPLYHTYVFFCPAHQVIDANNYTENSFTYSSFPTLASSQEQYV